MPTLLNKNILCRFGIHLRRDWFDVNGNHYCNACGNRVRT